MRKALLAAAAAAATAFASGPAQAGLYSNDLGRCMVDAATAQDRAALTRWIYGAMSQHPAVKSLSTITPDEQRAFTRAAVAVMERLMLQDCREKALAAVKNEGPLAIQESLQLLGEVAGRGLMADPAVNTELNDAKDYLDKPKWEAFGKAAGLPVTPQN